MTKIKKKMNRIENHVKNIRSATFRNLDETFRACAISQELGIPESSIFAQKFPTTSGSWAWKYTFHNNEFGNLTDVVTAVIKSQDEKNISSSSNIFVKFRDFITEYDYDLPVCEEELLELLREFARDIWIEVGDISDIRTHYQTFKKLYLKNDFESFIMNQT